MAYRWLTAGLLITALTACNTTGGFRASNDPLAAPTPDASREAVDGLTVGHRLMAAGEYELALEAYFRAGGEQGITPDVLSAIGTANLKLGRLGQSEEVLRRAIELDGGFVPAWNNLGVVLMEKGEFGEAERVFRTAFALDNGESDEIRQNLNTALAKLDNSNYDAENNNSFSLMRRGRGDYRLLATQ
ncbi:MAG: tetratricopeptide repeat protein [Pseudomonadota bacterium]